MNCISTDVVLQEVPDETSISFFISGCDLRCKGCHTPEGWNKDHGEELTLEIYTKELLKYRNLATCVLFYGGEWEQDTLCLYLSEARKLGFKTCLYTGENDVSDAIKSNLNYLKTGPWMEDRGNLLSKDTNQIFKNLDTDEIINYKFWKD